MPDKNNGGFFVSDRINTMKSLCERLKKRFSFVGILGCNVESRAVRADKNTASVSELPETDRGYVIRMYDGGCVYEYSSDDIEDSDAFAEKAACAATVDAGLKDRFFPPAKMHDEPLEKIFTREGDADDYTDGQLLGFARDLAAKTLAADGRTVNAVCLLRVMKVEKVYVGEKRTLTQRYSYANGTLAAVMKSDGRLVRVRECADSHLIKDVLGALPGRIARLTEKGGKLLHASAVVPGEYDVITDPSITGLLAHEAFGHGVEMDQFVKDRALAKYYMGKQVASPLCNMRDGAAACLSVASYFFDDDGVLAGDTRIIKDGVLVGGLCDAVSAGRLGIAPTGNGRRESHKRKAYSRMTNTFFEGGTHSLGDMIASIKHGYMLFETNNGMEDPKNWAIQCTAEYGIEIVDGVLTDNYVAPVVMSGYVPDVLQSISMVSDGVEMEGAGMCGKGYKEWVRVSDGGPCLKARMKLG